MDDILTARQINEWQAYDTLESIDGTDRIEFMLAALLCMATNALRSFSKSHSNKTVNVTDFIPNREEAWWEYYNSAYAEFDPEIKARKQKDLDDKIKQMFGVVAIVNKEKGGE